MTEDGTASDPGPVVDSSPIQELEEFAFPADEEFAGRVRESIDRREAASSFADLSTRGFLRLLVSYLSTVLGVFFHDSEADETKKEP